MAYITTKDGNRVWVEKVVELGTKKLELLESEKGYEFYLASSDLTKQYGIVCETDDGTNGEVFLNGISARDKYERLVKNAR